MDIYFYYSFELALARSNSKKKFRLETGPKILDQCIFTKEFKSVKKRQKAQLLNKCINMTYLSVLHMHKLQQSSA